MHKLCGKATKTSWSMSSKIIGGCTASGSSSNSLIFWCILIFKKKLLGNSFFLYWIVQIVCNIIAAGQRGLRGVVSDRTPFSNFCIQMPAECVPWISTSTIMPPRKTAVDKAAVDPPRRSGRIASQPVTAAAEEKPKDKATKKRTAGGEAKDGEGSTTKKVLSKLFFFFQFYIYWISILILLWFFFLLSG